MRFSIQRSHVGLNHGADVETTQTKIALTKATSFWVGLWAVSAIAEASQQKLLRGAVRQCAKPCGPIFRFLSDVGHLHLAKRRAIFNHRFVKAITRLSAALKPITLLMIEVHACHFVDGSTCRGNSRNEGAETSEIPQQNRQRRHTLRSARKQGESGLPARSRQ